MMFKFKSKVLCFWSFALLSFALSMQEEEPPEPNPSENFSVITFSEEDFAKAQKKYNDLQEKYSDYEEQINEIGKQKKEYIEKYKEFYQKDEVFRQLISDHEDAILQTYPKQSIEIETFLKEEGVLQNPLKKNLLTYLGHKDFDTRSMCKTEDVNYLTEIQEDLRYWWYHHIHMTPLVQDLNLTGKGAGIIVLDRKPFLRGDKVHFLSNLPETAFTDHFDKNHGTIVASIAASSDEDCPGVARGATIIPVVCQRNLQLNLEDYCKEREKVEKLIAKTKEEYYQKQEKNNLRFIQNMNDIEEKYNEILGEPLIGTGNKFIRSEDRDSLLREQSAQVDQEDFNHGQQQKKNQTTL
jgi:hypothetical protein